MSASALWVELLSDATFGRGEGTAGEVDVEVEHDDLGLPFLGGKTLRGLLRDSWLAMRHCFPTYESAARRLLGPEGDLAETAILEIGDATVPDQVRRWVDAACHRKVSPLAPEDVLRALTDVRRQTALSRATGAPARTTLRARRTTVRGLRLRAALVWLSPPDEEDLVLLRLCAQGVRHAGLARNRGSGHVHVCVEQAAASEPTLPSTQARTATTAGVGEPTWVPPTVYLPFRLELRRPAILAAPSGDPNSAATLDHIPGAAIRGAVAGALVRMDAPDLNELALSGDVRFLAAYPEAHGDRSLPAPVSWRRDRAGSRLVDLASLDEEAWPTGKLLRPEHRYWSLGEASPVWAPVALRARVHQQRDRAKGRAWTERTDDSDVAHGAIFSYQYLAAGQIFVGCLAVNGSTAEEVRSRAERVRAALGERVTVGRSRRSGYGGDARIEWLPPP